MCYCSLYLAHVFEVQFIIKCIFCFICAFRTSVHYLLQFVCQYLYVQWCKWITVSLLMGRYNNFNKYGLHCIVLNEAVADST